MQRIGDEIALAVSRETLALKYDALQQEAKAKAERFQQEAEMFALKAESIRVGDSDLYRRAERMSQEPHFVADSSDLVARAKLAVENNCMSRPRDPMSVLPLEVIIMVIFLAFGDNMETLVKQLVVLRSVSKSWRYALGYKKFVTIGRLFAHRGFYKGNAVYRPIKVHANKKSNSFQNYGLSVEVPGPIVSSCTTFSTDTYFLIGIDPKGRGAAVVEFSENDTWVVKVVDKTGNVLFSWGLGGDTTLVRIAYYAAEKGLGEEVEQTIEEAKTEYGAKVVQNEYRVLRTRGVVAIQTATGITRFRPNGEKINHITVVMCSHSTSLAIGPRLTACCSEGVLHVIDNKGNIEKFGLSHYLHVCYQPERGLFASDIDGHVWAYVPKSGEVCKLSLPKKFNRLFGLKNGLVVGAFVYGNKIIHAGVF